MHQQLRQLQLQLPTLLLSIPQVVKQLHLFNQHHQILQQHQQQLQLQLLLLLLRFPSHPFLLLQPPAQQQLQQFNPQVFNLFQLHLHQLPLLLHNLFLLQAQQPLTPLLLTQLVLFLSNLQHQAIQFNQLPLHQLLSNQLVLHHHLQQQQFNQLLSNPPAQAQLQQVHQLPQSNQLHQQHQLQLQFNQSLSNQQVLQPQQLIHFNQLQHQQHQLI